MAFFGRHKWFTGFLVAFLTFCTALFTVFTAWVVGGPRSLDSLTPYIESALVPAGGDFTVKIGSSLLIWDGVEHPIGIRVRDMYIRDKNGKTLAHFPEVGVRMYLFELLLGRIDLKSVELFRPTATLVQNEHGDIVAFGFNDDSNATAGSMAAAFTAFTSDKDDNPLSHLESFVIHHASLSVDDSHGKVFLSSHNASLEVVRHRGKATGNFSFPLQFGNEQSEFHSQFEIDGKHQAVTSNLRFHNIPFAILHAFAPSQGWMEGFNMPLSGKASVVSNFEPLIQHIDFSLDAGPGTIDYPGQIEGKLHLQSMKASGTMSDNLNTLMIKKGAAIAFKEATINFDGTLHRQGEIYAVDGEADTKDVTIDELHRYWPLKLAQHSRHWVTTRVSKGKIVKASVVAHFKPGDFKLKDTPNQDVDANIEVRGATIQYRPGHPPVNNISGTVRFTGETMDAKVTSAEYLSGTRVTRARLSFPDFAPADVRMFVDFDVEGPAKDAQKFLALPEFNLAKRLNLTPDITGKASGNAKLDFIAFADNPKNDVSATGKINYAVSGRIEGVTQSKFMNQRDVADAYMKIDVNNKGMKASGDAKINQLPMTIDLSSTFGKASETKYNVKTNMPVERMPSFNLPKLDFAKGTIGANASFTSSDTTDTATADLDLTQASIDLPQHGFTKPLGEKASLKLTTQMLPNGNTLISSFALKGPNYAASGKAEYDKAMQDFGSLSFSPLRVAGQDLESLDYQKKGNAIAVNAKGKAFNAAPYVSRRGSDNDNLSYNVNIRVDRLILGNNREMTKALVQADCPPDQCKSARISATLKGGTPFLYRIAGGKLEATCDDAGELARVLGIFDTISGGKMLLTGEYKDGKLGGTLLIQGYTLKNAPVLTKMFTIASLTGMLDTLTGNGVYFDKLNAPYIYHRGVLVIKDARSHGSALGFTADGTIDMNQGTLDINGVLVPSYTINSIVGNIPLLGDLLMGGKGKGLLALNYNLHGDMSNPGIRVNPLSVLTPGFLRDIFNIFDKPVPNINTSGSQSQSPLPVQ